MKSECKMDSIGTILEEMHLHKSPLVRHLADRLEALTTKPVAWMFQKGNIHKVDITPHGGAWEPLFAAPPAPAAPVTREPDGYAYEYPFEIGGTVIRHNNGQEVNGSRPLRSIPYWYGEPPAPAVPDDVMRELKWAVENPDWRSRTAVLLFRLHKLLAAAPEREDKK